MHRSSLLAILFIVCYIQSSIASSGALFKVTSTETAGNVSITLCLNGKGPLSCQNYIVNSLVLSILTTIPNRTYPYVGIKVNTTGYKLGDVGSVCTILRNGFCVFSANNNTPTAITLKKAVEI